MFFPDFYNRILLIEESRLIVYNQKIYTTTSKIKHIFMKLGFDIDDCITKTTETFCKVGNQLFNLNLEPNLLNSNSVKFEDIGLVTYEQVVKIKEKIS